MELNQSNTARVFLQRLILAAVDVSLTILCNICLLIRPISDFVGLINRHVGALSKLGLCIIYIGALSKLGLYIIYIYIYYNNDDINNNNYK